MSSLDWWPHSNKFPTNSMAIWYPKLNWKLDSCVHFWLLGKLGVKQRLCACNMTLKPHQNLILLKGNHKFIPNNLGPIQKSQLYIKTWLCHKLQIVPMLLCDSMGRSILSQGGHWDVSFLAKTWARCKIWIEGTELRFTCTFTY